MTQSLDWPKSLTAVIAGQVQRIRGQRGMSAQQLADATTALGHPVPRSVIANLESGRRDTVSIAELLVLARALRVPPLLLIFPMGHEPTTEVLPDVTVDTWVGAKWFTGETDLPTAVLERFENWEWREAPPAHFRDQDAMFAEWNRAKARARTARMEGDDEGAEFAERVVQRVEQELRRHRVAMRKIGLDPGDLNAELAHVDEADDGER